MVLTKSVAKGNPIVLLELGVHLIIFDYLKHFKITLVQTMFHFVKSPKVLIMALSSIQVNSDIVYDDV